MRFGHAVGWALALAALVIVGDLSLHWAAFACVVGLTLNEWVSELAQVIRAGRQSVNIVVRSDEFEASVGDD